VTNEKEKKPLGINVGTLGLSGKTLGSKLSLSQQSKIAAPSNKGKVVVVTKSARGASKSASSSNASGQFISDKDKERRLQLLKDADAVKKLNQEKEEKFKQEALQKKKTEEKSSLNQPKVEEKDVATSNPPTLKPSSVIQAQSYPVKKTQSQQPRVNEEEQNLRERIKLKDIGSTGKIKNLDSLYKPAKPEKPALLVSEVKPQFAPTKNVGKKKEDNIEEKDAFARKAGEERKSSRGKITVAQVMMMDSDEPGAGKRRSIASLRRAREKAKRKMMGNEQRAAEKVIREVNIPDVITVADLANRMAEKAADVIKSLMKLGMMVTVNQSLDADTAELVVTEFGHKVKRVTDAELESSLLQKTEDTEETLLRRPPVVTVMGHVDHGKTSLLDALRHTDVVAGEAGGITQHIGAYQVHLKSGQIITFLDTPGHEAFTAMRMRGAKVTDIVVLVVAADDGIKPQTIEAISHAKAANVPIIVAINKIDKPDASPSRVRNEILVHGLVPDDMGGDTMVVEVSAKEKRNLDKLEEAILIQAEMLDLKANPDRSAEGAVVEAKVDKGRGTVATVLVQKGTLKVGDIIVAGATLGKIRALINDKGVNVSQAGPSTPIEILGLEEAPVAGDEFSVVNNEKIARDIIVLRNEREKQRKSVASKSVTLDQLFKRAQTSGGLQELPVIIKADVQGSVEAIAASLHKLATEEIAVRVLHSAVGGITESDVTLASASRAIIIGFNVRANQQARDMARINGIDIRYYSIIYNLVDDVKAAMGGMLSPLVKENIIGYVEIRQVFDLSKYGKIAGCYVTEGLVKKTANVRIIRDSVVIYDGKLKALKRFKDDVREANSGFECGISLENYDDIKPGDRIEVYEITEHARTI
jgi:translation initiation factor IF-2